jgi:hypothetical protein
MQLSYGATDAFNAMLYRDTNPETASFLQNQIEAARNLFTNAGQAFVDRAHQAFHHYNSSEALRFARKAVAAVQGAFEVPRIQEYTTLSQIQNASLLMQRWMMANPTVREMYFKQRCDGYSDTYVDMEPARFGDEHYDYRRVMNGIVEFEADGGWKTTQFFEDLREGDRELILEEQVAITSSWTVMNVLMAMGKDDPTSPVGGKL